ncbi:HSP70/90 family co-chaperone CNS1 KNAG_0A03950 [Huiozyma naganishii CBS 8797]|uniref:Cns1/TTC4 wheel domain-containing protein n=1 Tax=Huiozyma naganishii (strain ATCC MYA-139 / BCRC 22969 / CBS 8797 / KCTC 17520 / NBRC 10181 / NCYC 3082 / Yp74L-3) TaxID=1071383 RepID=J7S2B8_HUIN7|nr:hypothetical protein KNAG_0A03950 [Kazachstania naganishii CBS 8797]CCK68074.1 hypothetical protein KNAG_0A03950 [Kazachstania naganishii CBS 8797]
MTNFDNTMSNEYKKPTRYVPGPNDPLLPPQLSDFKDKSTDEVMQELNRMPFFMTQLDNSDGDGGENVELEALKALAYEGEPHEIAENFKNQANDLYKVKRFRDARELYTKGIKVFCEDKSINESLFANRAACELELKNYRSCVADCQKAMEINPMNLKCFYRMGKAFLALGKFKEAHDAVSFGLKIDEENVPLKNLLAVIAKRETERKEYDEKKLKEKEFQENKKLLLKDALELRNLTNLKTSKRSALLGDAHIKLEDPMDFESQVIYPALVMYPTTNEFDFIAEVGELTTVQELLDLVMDRPQEWFDMPNHQNFSAKKLVAYMETKSGGLIKAGKKLSFHDILKKETPDVPVLDDAIKIYFVPKVDSEEWVSKWDKSAILAARSG